MLEWVTETSSAYNSYSWFSNFDKEIWHFKISPRKTDSISNSINWKETQS